MPLPNHILLALLVIIPVLSRASAHEARPGALRVHEESGAVLDQISLRLRVPRRDKERARLTLMGASRVLFKAEGRGLLSGLARKSYAEDALTILALCAIANEGKGKGDALRLAGRIELSQVGRHIVEILEARR